MRNRIPELYAYCWSAYNQPSFLFFGPYTVLSQEGAQQGDPIGPLLFCNTIRPMLLSLQAPLTLGFLDDVTLGGPVKTVASDVEKIISAGMAIGLSLNISKCELIAHKDLRVDGSALLSFKKVDTEDTTLLGTPLFPGLVPKAWEDRCEDLARAAGDINSQDALIVLAEIIVQCT